MTKAKMIEHIVDVTVDTMDTNELIEYAKEMMAKDMAKLPLDEIQEQYDYISG